ncbi:MAG TPA: hypothetical protein VF773_20125 [Verrucomicrobiae bacterium]
MKRKPLFVALAALVAVGLWLARSSRHSENSASDKTPTAYFQTPESQAAGQSDPGQTNNARPQHRPPNQAQRFLDFTPEQRVQQARKGHGPGG